MIHRPSAFPIPGKPARRQVLRASLAALCAFPLLGLSRPWAAPAGPDPALLARAVGQAEALSRLHGLIIAHDGVPLVEEAFRGSGLDAPVNVKSVAKTIVAALVGVAIDKGVLDGTEQPVASILADRMPDDADPRLARVTIGHLLSMQAGLERTSGSYYGAWVSSRDWVRSALARPFVDEPGGRMLYSTGNSHILSAALTRASGRSTLQLAREWLGEPLGITIPAWQRDPQGVYFGGNNMALSPRALLALGEAYRQGGVYRGRRVLSGDWVRASWIPRTRSQFTGHAYGYGWFVTEARGYDVYYAWGFGGQMIHVVPELALTTIMTSDTEVPSNQDGYVRSLHALLADGILPAFLQAS